MKCRSCKISFERTRPLQVVCSTHCAAFLAVLKREAKEAKKQSQELRKRREAIKPRAQWMKEAQTAFNAWIRHRDAELSCVSCGIDHPGQWHCGHYLSTGARPELRFTESNCAKQCAPCNNYLSGNLVLYRAELIRRIGIAEVERLEGPSTTKKYTIDELRAIRDDYRKRLK